MKKGFTLIEIILAISFLLIVTVMVVPNMYTVMEKNNEKQLAKIESLLKVSAAKYLSEDLYVAEKIKAGDAEYDPFYISISDLKRLGFVPSGLKDPTQGNQIYEYSNIIKITYTAGEFAYLIEKAQDSAGEPKLLSSKLYIISTTDFVWYSGLKWQLYKISDTVDGTDVDPEDPEQYNNFYHLKLIDDSTSLPNVPFTINCSNLERKLLNKANILVKRASGNYCTENPAGVTGNTIVLKKDMLYQDLANPRYLAFGSGSSEETGDMGSMYIISRGGPVIETWATPPASYDVLVGDVVSVTKGSASDSWNVTNAGSIIGWPSAWCDDMGGHFDCYVSGDFTVLDTANNMYTLVGDYKGYPGQELGQRTIGEYVVFNSETLRISNVDDTNVTLSNGDKLSLNSKIANGSGTLVVPYQLQS